MELQTAVEEYIARKRLMGFRYEGTSRDLRALVRFFPSVSIDQIRVTQVEKFLNRPTSGRDSWIARYVRFKAFFSYWRARRELARIPLPRSRRPGKRIFSPYVFTTFQIKSLLKHSSALDHRLSAIEPDTFRALLIALYATGMWVGEALSLLRRDFDQKTGVIHLHSRFGNDRQIPIGPDLGKVLNHHLDGSVASDLIFSTKAGTRIDLHRAAICFRRCLKRSGIRREDGACRQPGLRDLRHSFAVNRVTHWQHRGLDMDLMLPRLAAYMGLSTFSTPERYLSLAPTHFQKQVRVLS
jgi:integrase/recombinase XerD